MKKRYLKLDELVNGLPESTIASNHPDKGGICGDDDHPPGNIVFGSRSVRRKFFNKLTSYQTIWDVDDKEDFKWDYYKNLAGMEDVENYSNTLQGLEKVIPADTWNNVWKKMKRVTPQAARAGFIAVGQTHRGAEDRTGLEPAEYATLDWNDRRKNAEIEDDKTTDLLDKVTKITL